MLGFKHLEAFVTVIDEKSFTKAAEKLFLTQPTLSIQIKNLEKDLGVELIERKDKDIYLTDAGKILYGESKKILESMNRIREALDELKTMGRGSLMIGASTLPGEYIVPLIISSYQKLYPGIKIKMMIGDTNQILDALLCREIQVGFLGAPAHDSRLEIREFKDDTLYLITSPDWPDNRDWERFPFGELILREKGSGTRQVIEEYLIAKYGARSNIAPKMEVGSTRAIINLVAAGLGISFVSGWAAEESIKLGKIKALSVPGLSIKRTVYTAILKDSYLSYAARAFWDMIVTL